MKLTTLLLLSTLTTSAQVTLTPMQVRTVHAIMDNEARLREQALIDSADLADHATALRQSETLRIKAEADAKDIDTLRVIAVRRADDCEERLVRQSHKTKGRGTWATILGTIAAVEAAVIVGWAVTR